MCVSIIFLLEEYTLPLCFEFHSFPFNWLLDVANFSFNTYVGNAYYIPDTIQQPKFPLMCIITFQGWHPCMNFAEKEIVSTRLSTIPDGK